MYFWVRGDQDLSESTMIFRFLRTGGLKNVNSGSVSLCSWKVCELLL